MKKKIISTVIFSATAMIVGIILILSAFAAAGFDYNALNGQNIVHEQFTVEEEIFGEIEIDSDTVDVEIIIDPEADKTYVDFYQDASVLRNVKHENGKLTVESGDRPWYKNIGIFWGRERLTVTLPTPAQGKVNIETDTGDVKIDLLAPESISVSTDTGDVSFGTVTSDVINIETDTGDVSCGTVNSDGINIETDTGDVSLRGTSVTGVLSVSVKTGDVMINSVTASSLRIESTTGDVEIKDTITTAKMSIATDTGEVEINGADAPDIYIHTSTGDVEAAFYTGKIFDIDTSTGDWRVPTSDPTGGKCRIITSTGDIDVRIVASTDN